MFVVRKAAIGGVLGDMKKLILAGGPLSGWWNRCLGEWRWLIVRCLARALTRTMHSQVSIDKTWWLLLTLSSLPVHVLFFCPINLVPVRCCEKPQTIRFSRSQPSFDGRFRYSHCHVISGPAPNKDPQGQPNEGHES
jgi:hypothetical protein